MECSAPHLLADFERERVPSVLVAQELREREGRIGGGRPEDRVKDGERARRAHRALRVELSCEKKELMSTQTKQNKRKTIDQCEQKK